MAIGKKVHKKKFLEATGIRERKEKRFQNRDREVKPKRQKKI